MRLRRATNRDTLRLFKWANDPHVRRRSFSADPIAWDDHVRWFEERVTSDRCWMYVAEDESGEPMGQIRFDLIEPTSSRSASASPEVEVGVSIAAEHRGLGLAAPLIAAGVRAAAVDGCRYPTRATVRADNLPSQRAFVAADFDKTSTRSFRTDVVHDYRYAEPR
jgi:RimJ/RimL family protein N-acetyltransferase